MAQFHATSMPIWLASSFVRRIFRGEKYTNRTPASVQASKIGSISLLGITAEPNKPRKIWFFTNDQSPTQFFELDPETPTSFRTRLSTKYDRASNPSTRTEFLSLSLLVPKIRSSIVLGTGV